MLNSQRPSFAGIPTFARLPLVEDESELCRLSPDVAIVGAPIDYGSNHRPGSRFGPRGNTRG